MITRIVRLTIQENHIDDFAVFSEQIKTTIQSFSGCSELKILHNNYKPEIFMTYSIWDNEAALNEYRKSEFFLKIWPKAKLWFSAKPSAETFSTVCNEL